MNHWLAKPHQTEPQFLAWARDYPDWVELDTITQYVGLKAYSITVTDKSTPADKKSKLLFAVPHAHEPAGTVGCMQYLNQLLTGADFDGTPSDLERKKILSNCVLSFIPDANPDGRARAPVDYWDGTQYTNEQFWTFMRGRDPETQKMWKRLGRWSIREENPETIGIVYEQLNAHEYVEPNRDLNSAYFRLIQRIGERYGFGRWLDIHQTEFQNSPHNCMMLLPIVQNELPEEVQQINVEWAETIVEAWAKAGANPIRPSKPLGYTGQQGDYFRRVWREFMPTIPQVTTEVQNNNTRTPPPLQAKLQEIGIRVSVELLLA
jgi:murein tripeptide amidase MpaA